MPVTAFTPEIFWITYPHLQNLSHIGFHLTGKTTKSISRWTLAVKVRLERNLIAFFSLESYFKAMAEPEFASLANLHSAWNGIFIYF